jgi:hypothetical protein
MQARFDKAGKRLPDTGHGCGCQLCADSHAPRYERRRNPDERVPREWGRLRRNLVRAIRILRRNDDQRQVA